MNENIEFYETFFQKGKPYYLDKWAKFTNGQKFTFNVFAFLFGLFWFAYRKMYVEAIIVLILIIGETLLEDLILQDGVGKDASKVVSITGTVGVATIVAFLGNYFYMRKAKKVVRIAITKYTEKDQQMIFLKRKGGVSFLFLIIISAAILLIFIYNNYMANNGI